MKFTYYNENLPLVWVFKNVFWEKTTFTGVLHYLNGCIILTLCCLLVVVVIKKYTFRLLVPIVPRASCLALGLHSFYVVTHMVINLFHPSSANSLIVFLVSWAHVSLNLYFHKFYQYVLLYLPFFLILPHFSWFCFLRKAARVKSRFSLPEFCTL